LCVTDLTYVPAHRPHAIVEDRIAELKSASLAHPLREGQRHAASLAFAVMAHNLGRAVGHLAGPAATPQRR